jgi:Thymidylate kinase
VCFVTVYLHSSPEVCYERIQRRRRAEEITVPLSYLKELHESYEEWLLQAQTPAPVLVIDANKELDEVRQLCFQNQSYILGQCNMHSNPVMQSELKKTE